MLSLRCSLRVSKRNNWLRIATFCVFAIIHENNQRHSPLHKNLYKKLLDRFSPS